MKHKQIVKRSSGSDNNEHNKKKTLKNGIKLFACVFIDVLWLGIFRYTAENTTMRFNTTYFAIRRRSHIWFGFHCDVE